MLACTLIDCAKVLGGGYDMDAAEMIERRMMYVLDDSDETP